MTATTTAPLTIEEILAAEKAEHAAYEARTVATKIDGVAYTIADLRQVFDAVQNKDGWKLPWAASVPASMVRLVIEATKFYHADTPVLRGVEPITGNVLMQGKGYQAD